MVVALLRLFCPGSTRCTRADDGTATCLISPASVLIVRLSPLMDVRVPTKRPAAAACALANGAAIISIAARNRKAMRGQAPPDFVLFMTSNLPWARRSGRGMQTLPILVDEPPAQKVESNGTNNRAR